MGGFAETFSKSLVNSLFSFINGECSGLSKSLTLFSLRKRISAHSLWSTLSKAFEQETRTAENGISPQQKRILKNQGKRENIECIDREISSGKTIKNL